MIFSFSATAAHQSKKTQVTPVQNFNEHEEGVTASNSRQVVPGLIILKFKESATASVTGQMTQIPSIDSKIVRYRGSQL